MTIPQPEPRVARFERMAFGLFLHWGLYSQRGRGEWIQHLGPLPLEEYETLKDTFTAEAFDARAIARLAKEAGMRYIVLTSRHHDGFSLYDTRGLNDYDAPHSAAGRDLIAEFVEECQAEGIAPFLYHTTLDWHWRGLKTFTCSESEFNEYLDYLYASVEILCSRYGPLGGLWFDGNWSRSELDWKVDRLYSMIRRHQPEAIVINNTGLHERGKIGHSEIDAVTFEQSVAKPMDRRGLAKYVAGETCLTMNSHWGRGANDLHYKSLADLIEALAQCRRAGANCLLNVGPKASGAIPELETALLRKMGQWVRAFAPAIYEAKPSPVECQGKDFLLQSGSTGYYFAFDLGIQGLGDLLAEPGGTTARALWGLKRGIKNARWMDSGGPLRVVQDAEAGLTALELTPNPYGSDWVIRVAELELES